MRMIINIIMSQYNTTKKCVGALSESMYMFGCIGIICLKTKYRYF